MGNHKKYFNNRKGRLLQTKDYQACQSECSYFCSLKKNLLYYFAQIKASPTLDLMLNSSFLKILGKPAGW